MQTIENLEKFSQQLKQFDFCCKTRTLYEWFTNKENDINFLIEMCGVFYKENIVFKKLQFLLNRFNKIYQLNSKNIVCKCCNGSGYNEYFYKNYDKINTCFVCNGTGKVYIPFEEIIIEYENLNIMNNIFDFIKRKIINERQLKLF